MTNLETRIGASAHSDRIAAMRGIDEPPEEGCPRTCATCAWMCDLVPRGMGLDDAIGYACTVGYSRDDGHRNAIAQTSPELTCHLWMEA